MKRKRENKNEGALEVLESRLKMQTVQRCLAAYNLPPDSKFLKSSSFKEKFTTWPQYKKKSFLLTVAGVYWKTLQGIIEE